MGDAAAEGLGLVARGGGSGGGGGGVFGAIFLREFRRSRVWTRLQVGCKTGLLPCSEVEEERVLVSKVHMFVGSFFYSVCCWRE